MQAQFSAAQRNHKVKPQIVPLQLEQTNCQRSPVNTNRAFVLIEWLLFSIALRFTVVSVLLVTHCMSKVNACLEITCFVPDFKF